MNIPIGGWKSKLGALIIAIGAVVGLKNPALGEAIKLVGQGLLGLGIAHKIAKANGL